MLQTKYLIIIGIIICLLVLYYFYDEITSTKKLFLPAYQKTMALESRVIALENRLIEPKKVIPLPLSRNDSPIESITYHSGMVSRDGNLSVRYENVTETEAKELLKRIEVNKKTNNQLDNKQINKYNSPKKEPQRNSGFEGSPLKRKSIVQSGEISEIPNDINVNKITKDGDIYNEETDSFHVNFTDIIKNKSTNNDVVEMVNLRQKGKADADEYQQILDGLSMNTPAVATDENFSDDIDPDTIRSITESLQYADMPSEYSLSDIPKRKKSTKNKKI